VSLRSSISAKKLRVMASLHQTKPQRGGTIGTQTSELRRLDYALTRETNEVMRYVICRVSRTSLHQRPPAG
jgi:hypothetical protein